MLAERFRSFNPSEFAAAMQRSNGPVEVNWAGSPIHQFRKCIGQYQAKDGTLKPRMFYLGKNQQRAVHKARCLLMAWGVRRLVYRVDH